MPTLFDLYGIHFFFYSNEHEPIHVHIEYGGSRARIQVDPQIQLLENKGIKAAVIKQAIEIINDKRTEIVRCWNSYFDRS